MIARTIIFFVFLSLTNGKVLETFYLSLNEARSDQGQWAEAKSGMPALTEITICHWEKIFTSIGELKMFGHIASKFQTCLEESIVFNILLKFIYQNMLEEKLLALILRFKTVQEKNLSKQRTIRRENGTMFVGG